MSAFGIPRLLPYTLGQSYFSFLALATSSIVLSGMVIGITVRRGAVLGKFGHVLIAEDSLAKGTPRKAPTGQNLQQLDEIPWSLGGKSRKAKKVARSGTTTSWEN